MSKIGEILKAEREKKQMSLHEIAMSLKISPKILKAIEEGDTTNLPAKTFLRGFIRSYAQYLRLDVNAILTLFQEEMGSTRPEAPRDSTELQNDSGAEAKNVSPNIERTVSQDPGTIESMTGSSRFYMAIGGIFILIAIVFVVKMLSKYQKESEKSRAAVEAAVFDNLNASQATTTSTASVGEVSSTPNNVFPVMTATTTTTTTTTTTIEPIDSAALITPTTTTTTTLSKNSTRPMEVIVEALNSVTIRYQDSDGKWESLALTADQVHTFKFKGRMMMEVSDGGSVSLIVNGRDRGVPGIIGKSLKLSLP